MVKNPPGSAGDMCSIPRSERSPGEGGGNPLPYSWRAHGQRSLAGYNPQGRRESDRLK